MNRSRKFKKHIIKPDIKYNSVTVSALINKFMYSGNKVKATNIVYTALEILRKKFEQEPVVLLEAIIKELMPVKQLRSVRIINKMYKIPINGNPEILIKKTLIWFVKGSRANKDYKYSGNKAIINGFVKEGILLIEKKDLQKSESKKFLIRHNAIAKSNETFIHYL